MSTSGRHGGAAPRRVRLGFGCVGLGTVSGSTSWADGIRLVRRAMDLGIDLFDTADAYANGASERILGRALGRHRGEVTLATKVGYSYRERSRPEIAARRVAKSFLARLPTRRPGGANTIAAGSGYADQDFSPAYVRSAVEASLRRLRTDHIDVLQLHGPPGVMPDLLADVSDLVADGKVGRFGVGAESVHSASEWIDVPDVSVMQLPFGLLDPEAARDVLPLAACRSIEVWARGVFGGGMFAAADHDVANVTAHPKFALIQALRSLAAESGVDLYQLAVGYVSTSPGISAMLLGMSTKAHLMRNVELVSAAPVDPDVLVRVTGIIERFGGRETLS